MIPKFIFEIGSNHNQSWPRLINLITSAKELGAWAIKLQLFKANKLYSTPKPELKKRELPVEWIPKISDFCKSLNIKFGCTPFYLEAVDALKKYIDFFKISSFDTLRTDLIQKCINSGKQNFISLGLNKKYLNIDGEKHKEIIFFHCISNYPSKLKNLCLNRIKGQIKGYSDHSVSIPAIIQAIHNEAEYIEIHFDLDDMQGSESQYGHVWNETKIKKLFKFIKDMEIANSGEFKVTEDMKKLLADSITGLRNG